MREQSLSSYVVGGATKSLALRFVASIIDLSPILGQQFIKAEPRLFT
jgi:hypothetical protein